MKKNNIDIIRDYLDGNRPYCTVGYTPKPKEKHKDGDVWTENGTEWIQVGPSKISKKLYDIKESTRRICSRCKRDLSFNSNRFDEKFFNMTGKCYDCTLEDDTRMNIEGTFHIYEKIKILNNQKSFLKDLKQKIEESIKFFNNKSNKIQFVNEDGSLENWSDFTKEGFLSEAKIDLEEVNKSIILCNESISMLNEELNAIKTGKQTDAQGNNKN